MKWKKTQNADNCLEIMRKTTKNLSQGNQSLEIDSNYAHFECVQDTSVNSMDKLVPFVIF